MPKTREKDNYLLIIVLIALSFSVSVCLSTRKQNYDYFVSCQNQADYLKKTLEKIVCPASNNCTMTPGQWLTIRYSTLDYLEECYDQEFNNRTVSQETPASQSSY